MDLLSVGIWRHPQVEAQQFGDEWWVTLEGAPQLVLPQGVLFDDDYDNEPPKPLRETLHEVMKNLDNLDTLDTDGAAQHLADHFRRYGALDLCGAHGRPIWHAPPRHSGPGLPGSVTTSCAYPGETPDGGLGIKVTNVTRFVKHLRGLEQIADHLARRRERTRDWMISDVLEGEFIDPRYADVVKARHAVGNFDQEATRRLLRYALDSDMQASKLTMTMRWPGQRRPELALVANTVAALYVADVIAHIGSADPDRTFLCSVCGLPFTPKRRLRADEGVYCRRLECRRARNLDKQRRYLAKRNP